MHELKVGFNRMVALIKNRALLNILCICLAIFSPGFYNVLSAQTTNVEDPCMSLSTTTQASRSTETRLKKINLSAIDSSLYKYWNKSSETKAAKLKKIAQTLNSKKPDNVVSYAVDPCDPGGGGGCTIQVPIPEDGSSCGPGNVVLSAFPGAGGNTIYWYEDYSSTLPFSIGNSVTVYVTESRYYYLSSYNTSTGCESSKTSVYVTVGGWGVDGTISAPVTAIYLGQSVTISSTGGVGEPHYWASSNGGTSWNVFSDSYIGQTSFTYTPTAIGTYRFMLRNKTGCGFCYDNGTCPNYPYVDVLVINSSSSAQLTRQSSFIYGYNKSIPIAEIINAGNGQVAYSSFESSDKGNWNYVGVPVGSPTDAGRTGNKYYELASGSIQRTGLPAGKYLVTYWSKGDPAITGTNYTLVSKVTEVSIDGWILYRITFTLSAGGSAVTISGTSKIDEVRLHPHTANMITSTFDPLVGKTSETDSNNRTMYYLYDDFNRLKVIKDQNGNIRKSFVYNYKN